MSGTNFLPLDFLSWAHIKHTWKGDNDEFQKQVSFDSSKNLRPSLSILGAKRPMNVAPGYIFYINPKYFQSAWKKYHANSMETFGKIDENLTFAYFGLIQVQKDEIYGHWGPYFKHLRIVFPVSLKTSSVWTRGKDFAK